MSTVFVSPPLSGSASAVIQEAIDSVATVQAADWNALYEQTQTIQNLGNYSHIANCEINGTIRSGDHCIFSNCIINVPENSNGIYIEGNVLGTSLIGNIVIGGYGRTSPSTEQFSKEELEKAERFLFETVGEENDKLLASGKVLGIKASNGWTYGVKLNGDILKQRDSKVFQKEPEHGRLLSSTLPMPDLIASFFIWVKTNPDELEKRWGCGNITIEDKTEIKVFDKVV